MKTFDTYAAAKIANPKSFIATNGTSFAATSELFLSDAFEWSACNQADHCSTLAEFLAAGYLLVDGDVYLSTKGFIRTVGAEIADRHVNMVDGPLDNKLFILSASALNGGSKIPAKPVKLSVTVKNDTGCTMDIKPAQNNELIVTLGDSASDSGNKKMKVEYVRVNAKAAIKAVMGGSTEHYFECSGNYSSLTMESPLSGFCNASKRIETPIDPRQEWIDAAYASMNGLDGQTDVCTEHLAAIYDAGLAKDVE